MIQYWDFSHVSCITSYDLILFMFSFLINIGLSDSLSSKETKRVILLNKLALLSSVFNLFFGISILFIWGARLLFYLHVSYILFMLTVIILQQYKRFITARVLFWLSVFVFTLVFSKAPNADINNDYYFAILAVIPLLFFDNRVITISGLLLSIIGFYALELADIIFDFQSIDFPIKEKHLNSAFILFTILYFVVDYFKKLNEKNEKALEKEKDKALSSSKTIESQNQKLEELNEFQSHFFVNISHELRTPLTLIQGNNDKLMSLPATQYNPELKSIGQTIGNQSSKIKSIVDDVIDLAKMEVSKLKLELRQVELRAFVTHLYHSFHSTFEHKGIRFDLSPNLPSTIVQIDTLYFERALNNIILNALKYTPKGGNVTLATLVVEDERYVSISIEDTGVGIPLDEIDKVFHRFYQSENEINKAGGSGIGLAFSKEVIEMHNGKITIKSTPDNGAKFIITIPVISIGSVDTGFIPNESSITIAKPKPVQLNTNADYCILIVDDHEDMRDYIQNIMSNYRCLLAEDGIQGLELIKTHQVHFVITDYMMPNMNGYEFIAEIRKTNYIVPILMLSARTDIEGKLNVLRLGIDDYLTKPFNKEELQIRVANALSNYESMSTHNETNVTDTSNTVLASDEDRKWLDSLQSYTEKHCHRTTFGLPDLNTEFAMSQSTLYRKLKSLTGLSPNEFIREVKLQRARKYVETNKFKTVKELSYAVGFQKTSHFSNLYEKRFGMRPLNNE